MTITHHASRPFSRSTPRRLDVVYVDNGTPIWTPRFITEEPRPASDESLLSRFMRGAAARMRQRTRERQHVPSTSGDQAADEAFTRFRHGPRRRRTEGAALLFPWTSDTDPDGTPSLL